MSLLDRLPRAPAFAVACGVLMVLPTIAAGWFMDDALARVKLLGVDTPWSPAPWWDLYTFARADLNPGLLAAGHHPWWADPDVRMTFFRPLSAATHALDYALWPHSPVLQHLHSVLWYGLSVAAAGALYRRLHGASTAAVVAGLAFAVAAPHAMTVGWLAGRNTLIAFVLGCFVVSAHLSWQAGHRRSAPLAVALLALGLLASEAALGALGYVFAWQVCVAQGPWRRRLAPLLPYAAVVVAWRVAYVAAGFGATGTGIYHDPGTDLPDFVAAVATHLPALFGGRWLPVPLDGWAVSPVAAHAGAVALGVVTVGLVAAIFWPLLRADRLARFWALGLVLALLPFTATMPMDRLVLFAGPGFGGLVGLLAARIPTTPWRRRARVAVLALHLPLAAAFGLLRGALLAPMSAVNVDGLASAPRDAAVPGQTFVYLLGTFHRTHYTTLMRRAAGERAVPRRSLVLASVFGGAEVTRIDARTLEVAPPGGYMAIDLDRIHRRVGRRFAVGDVIELPDARVEIVAITEDGRPARARFRFAVPLEDPSLRWLTVAAEPGAALPFHTESRPFAPPAIGETVRLPGLL